MILAAGVIFGSGVYLIQQLALTGEFTTPKQLHYSNAFHPHASARPCVIWAKLYLNDETNPVLTDRNFFFFLFFFSLCISLSGVWADSGVLPEWEAGGRWDKEQCGYLHTRPGAQKDHDGPGRLWKHQEAEAIHAAAVPQGGVKTPPCFPLTYSRDHHDTSQH